MNHSLEWILSPCPLLPTRDRDEDLDEDLDPRALDLLVHHSQKVLRRARFLGWDLPEEALDGNAADSGDSEIDPFDFARKELLCDLECVASEMAQVRLVVAELSDSPDSEQSCSNQASSASVWHVHDSGLIPWLGLEYLAALCTWVQDEAAAAAQAIKELLRDLKESGVCKTAIGILTLVLFAAQALGGMITAFDRRVIALLPLRVLAAGGQTMRFAPLA